MTNVPDFRGRIEGDKPQDFLHKIANIIPGYAGYQDRERRRDADKALRMYLARRFRDQHAELSRVQQQMARGKHMLDIGEVDRLGGVLQRFIDKLEVATQGYTGLFDPVKIEAEELDQIYTFDAALANDLDRVASAIDGVGSAAMPGSSDGSASGQKPDLQRSLATLGTVLDELLRTWNARNDVIMSGKAMPEAEFNKFRASVSPAPAAPAPYAAPPAAGSGMAGNVSSSAGSSSGSSVGGASGSAPPAAGMEESTRRLDSPPPPPRAVSEQTGKLPAPGSSGRTAGPSDTSGPPTGGPADEQ